MDKGARRQVWGRALGRTAIIAVVAVAMTWAILTLVGRSDIVGVGTLVGVGTTVGVGAMVGSAVGMGVSVGVGSGVFKEPSILPNGDEISDSSTSSLTVSAKGLKSVASADAVRALRSTVVSSSSQPVPP